MDPSQNCEEQILYSQLPELVWSRVLWSLGADFPTLGSCLKASNVFSSLVLENGQVSLAKDKILPSALRKRHSEPTLLLYSLVDLKPRIRVLEIMLDPDFRPEATLNLFLKVQGGHLEILYVSCVDLGDQPVTVNLPGMSRLRELKLMREPNREKSFQLTLAEQQCFPVLQKLTLSLGFEDDWADFFERVPQEEGTAYEKFARELFWKLRLIARFWRTPVKHVRFVDFTEPSVRSGPRKLYPSLRRSWAGRQYCLAVEGALRAFPNLESLEIPAMMQAIDEKVPGVRSLKRLTLTLPKLDRHKHTFDECITACSRYACAVISQEFYNNGELRGESYNHISPHAVDLTLFQNVEVVRIKSESAEWGPTVVSCRVFLDMESLKVLDFCGNKPMHIPDEMIEKMRERFTVLCG